MGFLDRVIQQVLKKQAQTTLEQVHKMLPLMVGDIRRQVAQPYAPFTEYDNPPNVIDSTATVIDPDVPVLPAPLQGESRV